MIRLAMKTENRYNLFNKYRRVTLLHHINEFTSRFGVSPRDLLRPRNVVIAGCASLIAYKVISKAVEMLIDFVDRKRGIPNIRVIFRKPYEPGLIEAMDDVLDKART